MKKSLYKENVLEKYNNMLKLFNKGEVIGETSKKTETIQISDTPTLPVITIDPSIVKKQEISKKTYSFDINTINLKTGTLSINPVNDANRKPRVLFCGTYPIGQSNGYSRVVYYISKYLGLKDDIELTIYGFQNYSQTAGSEQRNDLPPNLKLHDALATEDPKRNGFGEKEIGQFLKKNPQDIVIIFNDMVITSALTQTIITELSEEERKSFLLVSYMDQVYAYQKQQYIVMLNTYFDYIIAFTPYWKEVAIKLGVNKDKVKYVLPHGFDTKLYYPIKKTVARIFYQIPDDAFAILNLNRNQPRKRWDHTIMAFADVVARIYELSQKNPDKKQRPIRLVIATAIDGSWNLMEIYENELRQRGVPLDFGKNCIVALSKPQQLSDRDINILYNACDIGINTCSGGGWELTCSEHLGVGGPQIAPKIGGMQEYLNNGNSIVLEPKYTFYIDKGVDGIGGIAEIADTKEYADGIWKYYTNQKLVEKHGRQGRKEMLEYYRWEHIIGDYMYNVIIKDLIKNVPKK